VVSATAQTSTEIGYAHPHRSHPRAANAHKSASHPCPHVRGAPEAAFDERQIRGILNGVEFRQFEREFLRLAFTSSIDLSPASLAFVTGIPVREAEKHMGALVTQGVLELTSDDDGHLIYTMPDRPPTPLAADDPALVGMGLGSGAASPTALAPAIARDAFRPTHALAHRRLTPAAWPPRRIGSGQAVAAMFLNAMVCPGVGSLVGGKTGTGLAQLSLFLIGLPLAVIAVGLPLVLGAWVWGIATGAQLIAEARD
jgi:hypothetical protein